MPAPQPSTDTRRAARLVKVRSFDDRIRLIQRQTWRTVMDRDIRALATQLVTQRCRPADPKRGQGGWCVPERDRWAEAVVIFNFVRSRVRYTSDTYQVDTYQTGRRTLQLRAGDCDDYAILLSGLLLSIGHPMRFKSIELRDQLERGFSHIYPEVLVEPQLWRPLDASVSQIAGWEVLPSRVLRAR
ncbi:MAG TPA: hypothetical protein ENK57_03955, partial [Polyangiaceae bacterium]|nr:hypothetical protein [Polyangiaceae bacterium]